MSLNDLAQRIDSHFGTLSPELQRAARWVRDHATEFGLQSMRQSAQSAGVAPATMTRLARALGLGGFEELRRPVLAHLAQSAQRASPIRLSGLSSVVDEGLGALAQAQARNTASALDRNPPASVDAAATALLSARGVLFLGLRASFGIAYHLHYTCDWLRSGTQLALAGGGAMTDRLADLQPQDLLVVVSQAPYTRQAVEAAQDARRRGVPVLALTDSALSPLAQAAQCVLLFEAESPAFFHSMTGAQALAEVLMQAVARLGGEPVAQRLAERQQRLQIARAYWEKGPRGPRPAKRKTRSKNPSPIRVGAQPNPSD